MPESHENPAPDAIYAALQGVNDPELHRDLVTLGRVRHVEITENGTARIGIRLESLTGPIRQRLKQDIEDALAPLGLPTIEIEFSAGLTTAPDQPQPVKANTGTEQPQQNPQDQAREGNPLPDIKHIIAVGAGKGGVGKSTISVNLAVALARQGNKVGLMDGDIYGPSVPTMLGTSAYPPKAVGNTIIPYNVHGIKAMSVGSLVEDDQALIWRGPMAHGAFRQLATQTNWGELDYLIIDLPPGTGDVPLTMAQLLPLTGAVVVCTPQKVAQDDAKRAIAMFKQLGIEVLGLVENMSYFIGDDGKEYDLFGKGGAQMLAHQMGLPVLGQIPINTALRYNADAGDPIANFTGDPQLASELGTLASTVADQVATVSLELEQATPTITIRD
ncbi:MAG: Mrp/NBP35 family ATP-binding protein [Phycisphaeraceae bacterium]|nr:Mrp/NBP35 family ATP-binding protein [Phycisphaeraceae bacterium]